MLRAPSHLHGKLFLFVFVFIFFSSVLAAEEEILERGDEAKDSISKRILEHQERAFATENNRGVFHRVFNVREIRFKGSLFWRNYGALADDVRFGRDRDRSGVDDSEKSHALRFGVFVRVLRPLHAV